MCEIGRFRRFGIVQKNEPGSNSGQASNKDGATDGVRRFHLLESSWQSSQFIQISMPCFISIGAQMGGKF